MSKLMTCSIAALMLSCAAAKVQAAPAEGRPIVIKYADLDVSSPAGDAALRARVAAGVARFCGAEPALVDLSRHAAYRACIADATTATMARAQTLIAARHTTNLRLSQADATR
jgi:UrcA family protein